MNNSVLIGIGVGPGDPELITLKAYRAIEQADVIMYLTNEQGESQAFNLVKPLFKFLEAVHHPIIMPMKIDRALANRAYDDAALAVKGYFALAKRVVFLCEGDPLFFGSFNYLVERLQGHCQVIPGISATQAAAAQLCIAITQQEQTMTVLSGRNTDQVIVSALKTFDTVYILKAGKQRVRLLNLIRTAGRETDCHYLEKIGREDEYIERCFDAIPEVEGPYFSLFFITCNR